MKHLVVVLPTLNEKESIANTISEIFAQQRQLPGYKIYIVVADSESKDGTYQLVEGLRKKDPAIYLISVEKGLGVGLVKGHEFSLAHLKPDIMAQVDADGQVELEVLIKLVEAIEEGYNLALGSRFIKGGKNQLSFSRRLFSYGASFACKLIMGPWDIKEFTNSARAFTPQLFKKINLKRLPWKETTFIVQPAFLNEAVLSGAKYKEVPLVFKDRAGGYSKNKIINYSYDILAYVLDARLHKLGINIPLFQLSRKLKTFIKFGLVGLMGTTVDFAFYNFFISGLALNLVIAKGFSSEIAIVNNFTLNSIWTFRHRNTKSVLWVKFITFNLVSLGGVVIAVLLIKFLHQIYGDGIVGIFGVKVPYYNVYFLASVLPVLVWNFTINHFITWRHHKPD